MSDKPSREDQARAALRGRPRRQVALTAPNTIVPISSSSAQAVEPSKAVAEQPTGEATSLPGSAARALYPPTVIPPSQYNVATPEISVISPPQSTIAAGEEQDVTPMHQHEETVAQGLSGSTSQSDTGVPAAYSSVSTTQPFDSSRALQDSNVLSAGSTLSAAQQSEFASVRRGDTQPSQLNTSAPLHPGRSSVVPQINNAEPASRDTTESQLSENASMSEGISEGESHRDIAVSRYRDDSRKQQQAVQNTGVIEAETHEGLPAQKDDNLVDPESILASAPDEALAQLMQVLLVQPKVNKLNANAWRSGGMQVTHGTHRSYKLLADQYGVHMRDIVEQTLKACLPFWRARLQQLRAAGILDAEKAEEELDL